MRYLIVPTIFIFLLSNCVTHKLASAKNKDIIRTIAFVDTLPLNSNDGSNVIFYPEHEPRLVCYYKNYTLYRIASYITYNSMNLKNDSTIENIPYRYDTTYSYYIRKGIDSSIVYKINSIDDPVFRKLPADSLYMHASVYKKAAFDDKPFFFYATKISSYENSGSLIDKYIVSATAAPNVWDTAYLYFSKSAFWKSIPYDFSADAEKENKLKLVKLKFVWKVDPVAKEILFRKGMVLSYEMQEYHLKNEEEIREIFERFEKQFPN